MFYTKMRYSYLFLTLAVLYFSAGCSKKMVTITSIPSGAKLYLNGQNKGKTPYTEELEFEDDKIYKAVAEKEGYKEGKTTIAYEPTDTNGYHIFLKQIHKRVNITSSPKEADIYINGQNIGTAPIYEKYLLFKDVINFEVVARKDGYEQNALRASFLVFMQVMGTMTSVEI